MKAENEMTLTFPSRSANEAFARAAVACFAAQLDPNLEELNDIKTAVSEAVTNCIVHAYPERIGPVCMTIAVYPDREVHITIADKGIGIPNVEQAMQPLFTTGNPEERSGLGFAVMLHGQGQSHLKARQGYKGATGQASVQAGAYIKRKGGPVYGNG